MVSTLTSTSEVFASSSTTSPSTTSEPFTWKVDSEVSVLGKTNKVTVYVAVVSPSAAVTVTVRVFSPETRSIPPSTTKVAFSSEVTTTTSTSEVFASSSTTSPSTTSLSFTVNKAKDASSDAGTTRTTR